MFNDVIILLIIMLITYFSGMIHLEVDNVFFRDTSMLLGLLIIGAHFAGRLAKRFTLPRITGYILIGILFGPHLFNFIQPIHLNEFNLIDELALALIAFTAGAELNVTRLKKRIRSITAIIISQIFLTFIIMALFVFIGQYFFEFIGMFSLRTNIAIAMVIGIIAVAKSPAQTIAVIVETQSKGDMTDTILGVTIAKDIIVIIIFTIVLNIAYALHVGDPLNFANLSPLIIELISSLIVGWIFGYGIIFYLKNINKELLVFILATVFFITTLSKQLHLEFILTCITAGFVVENLSKYGHRFLEVVERSSLPIYLIFFSIAGANLDLTLLSSLWQLAIMLVVMRVFSVYLSTYVGARFVNDSQHIRHLSWAGFIGQAGVSLGLAVLVMRGLPDVGRLVRNIIVSTVMINSIIGPIAFKWALYKAGEAKAAA